MDTLDLRRIGGASALLYTALVVAFTAILFGTKVVEADGADEFLPILTEHKGLAFVASALLMIMPVLVALAGMALFTILRGAGSVTWIALFGFVAGGTVIIYRGFTWMALTLDLAPAYDNAGAAERPTLAAIGDTFDTFATGADVVGGVLIAGIGVLFYSVAMLRLKFGAPWIARIGIFAAAVGGWLTPFAPASELVEGIHFLGFLGFLVWITAVGILALRTDETDAAQATVSSPAITA